MIRAKDIISLTGLTYRQIQYWCGKIVPKRTGDKRYPLFTLNDLLIYCSVANLKKQDISLQRVRRSYLDAINRIVYYDVSFGSGSQIIRIDNSILHLRGCLTSPCNSTPYYNVVNYNDCVDKLKIS